MKFPLVIISALLLSGCKIGIETTVPFSGVFSDGVKEASSDLYIEVASCTSYEDSRQPSKSLLSAQQVISDIFDGASYKECYTKKMTSWAKFAMPVAYGPYVQGKEYDDGKFHIFSLDNKSVIVYAPEKIKQKINKLANDKSRIGSFNPSDVTFRVTFLNDLKRDVKMDIISSFVGDTPVIYSAGNTIKAKQSLSLLLSDVTTQVVLTPKNAAGWATVLHNIQ